MADSLDLNILPIIRQGGQDGVEIPGLYAVTPPRHPGRGREADGLVLYLTLTGNAPLAIEQYNQVLQRLAQAFYKTPGSVTAALRSVADTLNQFLLDRNHRSPGRQGIGILIQAVLRAGTIYLAHSGPAHTFLLTQQETQHFYDPLDESPGLGTSRTPITGFYQAKLSPGDFLVLSPPPGCMMENTEFRPGLESTPPAGRPGTA
jgi:hypothetical protein